MAKKTATKKTDSQNAEQKDSTIHIPFPLRQAPLISKKAKYKQANNAAQAKALVEEFVERALESPYLSYKEPFLGTPALFAYLLSTMDEETQRNLQPARVEQYRRLWQNDQWRAGAADDYCFCEKDGKLYLYDGQHRSTALLAEKAELEIWLSHTKDPLAYLGKDQGKNRNPADLVKSSTGLNLSSGAISAGIIEKLDFPPVYRAAPAEREQEVVTYDQLGVLSGLPKSKVGEGAALLRLSRMDPPGVPLAKAWIVAFIKGETDIHGVHVPTLKAAIHAWASENKVTNGDIRTKKVSNIIAFHYLGFYEGRRPKMSREQRHTLATGDFLISRDYVEREIKSGNRRMKIDSALIDLIRSKAK